MTPKQQLIKIAYPLLKLLGKLAPAKKAVLINHDQVLPVQSFYQLAFTDISGNTVDCNTLAGKKILIVNTASDCGYTAQLGELQQLHQDYGDKVQVIGFPSNDFKQQEKGSDEAIASFCQKNYGVTFLLAQKSIVINKPGQSPVFQWLSGAHLSGWCNQPPQWNFSKYLINENGLLLAYFPPGVSPLHRQVVDLL